MVGFNSRPFIIIVTAGAQGLDAVDNGEYLCPVLKCKPISWVCQLVAKSLYWLSYSSPKVAVLNSGIYEEKVKIALQHK